MIDDSASRHTLTFEEFADMVVQYHHRYDNVEEWAKDRKVLKCIHCPHCEFFARSKKSSQYFYPSDYPHCMKLSTVGKKCCTGDRNATFQRPRNCPLITDSERRDVELDKLRKQIANQEAVIAKMTASITKAKARIKELEDMKV